MKGSAIFACLLDRPEAILPADRKGDKRHNAIGMAPQIRSPETKWGPTLLSVPTNVGSFRPHALAGCAFRSGDVMCCHIFARENEPGGLFTFAYLPFEARRSLSRVPGIILKGLDPIFPAILAHGSSHRTIRTKILDFSWIFRLWIAPCRLSR
jgi:hypothetical protein